MTHSSEELQSQLPAVLRALRADRRPVVVVDQGKPAAVLQDLRTYQGTQDAIAVLRMMAQSEASVAAGRLKPTAEVLRGLRAQVKARRIASAS